MNVSTARVLDIATATTPEQQPIARQLLSGLKTLRQASRRVPGHEWARLPEPSRRSRGLEL